MNTRAKDLLAKRLNRAGSYAILIVVGIMVITPIVWLLLSSLKDDSNFMAWPIQILPAVWRWANYNRVFTLPSSHFVTTALRTAVIGVLYSAGLAISSAMGGYAFARYQDVKANHRLFRVIIVLLIVPGIVFLIPQFMLFSYLHIIPNTYWPWVLWALTGAPLYIFLYRQFFLGFPKELEEAAELDGCGPFRVFWQILLPNSKPVIATVSIFAFSGIWGDYITPMLFLSQKMTLMGVTMATAFVDPRGNALRTVSFAGTVLYVLPLVIMFFLGQKYILKGLITSGLKG
jgi:ABC-type glycerol-3-phosphate transport system permease component